MKFRVEVTTEETVFTRHSVTVEAASESEAESRAVALIDSGEHGGLGDWVHSEHGATEVFRVEPLEGGAS